MLTLSKKSLALRTSTGLVIDILTLIFGSARENIAAAVAGQVSRWQKNFATEVSQEDWDKGKRPSYFRAMARKLRDGKIMVEIRGIFADEANPDLDQVFGARWISSDGGKTWTRTYSSKGAKLRFRPQDATPNYSCIYLGDVVSPRDEGFVTKPAIFRFRMKEVKGQGKRLIPHPLPTILLSDIFGGSLLPGAEEAVDRKFTLPFCPRSLELDREKGSKRPILIRIERKAAFSRDSEAEEPRITIFGPIAANPFDSPFFKWSDAEKKRWLETKFFADRGLVRITGPQSGESYAYYQPKAVEYAFGDTAREEFDEDLDLEVVDRDDE